MAVYVDDVRHPFGSMIMCHLWADTVGELHAFAKRLDLKRSWFQQTPKSSWEHYDISLSKKKLALKMGAVLTDKFGPAEHTAKKRGNEKQLLLIKAARERRKKED